MIATKSRGPRPTHRRRGGRAALGAAVTAAAVLSAAVVLSAARPAGAAGATPKPGTVFRADCANAEPGHLSCMSRFRIPPAHLGARAAVAGVAGLGPADIASAYGLTAKPAQHPLVAIVDAFDDPKAEADLGVYRSKFGLPSCTTANGCFRKVNQRGAAAPAPDGDQGWGLEISLDLDAVSAACPTCRIMLVEADSDEYTDIGAAVDTAVRLGAMVVSNSYGGNENPGMASVASHWTHPGVSMVVSSGDSGFTTASFPAVLPTSIAVGGTTLTKASATARGWKEQAWSGAGSGCSAYIAKPAWQKDTHCLMRTVADVSAVADPETGLAMYDSYLPAEDAGFLVAGGTSLSAPLIAAMIARSGRVIGNASRIYANPSALYDVVGGSNGYCGGDYLCTGKRGYDAPTGMGSPHGVAAL
jgi:subtilase family serine protease